MIRWKCRHWWWTVGLTALLLTGCQQQPGPGSPRYIPMLREKAAQLAQSEIPRFNQLEQAHKNDIEYQVNELTGVRLFDKSYREFTGYEVEKILTNQSGKYPVTMVIKYYFNYYMTKPHHVEDITVPVKLEVPKDFRDKVWKEAYAASHAQDEAARRKEADAQAKRAVEKERKRRWKQYHEVKDRLEAEALERARKACEADSKFSLYYKNSLVRKYPCDAQGVYHGVLKPLPPPERLFVQKDPDIPVR